MFLVAAFTLWIKWKEEEKLKEIAKKKQFVHYS